MQSRTPCPGGLPVIELQAIIDLAKSALVIADVEGLNCPRASVRSEYTGDEQYSDAPLPDVVAPSFKAPVSGGSTGRPKIIVSGTPGEIDADDPFASLLRIQRRETFLLSGPLYHNAPFTFSVYSLGLGGCVVIMDRFDPEESLRLMDEHQVTYSFLVPTMMHRIWRLGESTRSKYALTSLRTILHAAAPCAPDLKENWIKWLGGDRLWELYGGTEAQGLSLISGDEWLRKPGSVGRMLDGFQAKICDDSGNELAAGEVGELYMRPNDGPGTTYTYIGTEPRQLDDGFESIGDMGYMDEDGYLFLADRRTDMIISGGANIYPAEVEAVLESHPGVRSAVAIGLPDEDLGQTVYAIVDAPDQPTEAELIEHCRQYLVSYKLPRAFEFVDVVLRDDAGKVRRSSLRDERINALTPAIR